MWLLGCTTGRSSNWRGAIIRTRRKRKKGKVIERIWLLPCQDAALRFLSAIIVSVAFSSGLFFKVTVIIIRLCYMPIFCSNENYSGLRCHIHPSSISMSCSANPTFKPFILGLTTTNNYFTRKSTTTAPLAFPTTTTPSTSNFSNRLVYQWQTTTSRIP